MDEPSSPDVVYAGFWRRLGAYVIDSFIISVALYGLLAIILLATAPSLLAQPVGDEPPVAFLAGYGVALVLFYVAAALYYGLQESSRHQATVGKRALGIKVADRTGARLSRGKAITRWFAAALSYLTLYIGFMIAAFTRRKQALHDLAVDTIVVDRWAFTESPERQQRHVGALAILLSMVLLALPVLAILAAIAIPAYQDYTVRARIAQAVATTVPLQATVAAHRRQEGTCPTNGEGSIGTAATYASGSVEAVEVGQMQSSGNCGLQILLRGLPTPDTNGKRLWLELDAGSGQWHCSSEVADRYLPVRCRG